MKMENKMEQYIGKLRAFIYKTDDDNSYKVCKITTFDDCLISDVTENPMTSRESLAIEIENIGLEGVENQITKVLSEYKSDTYIEILADAYFIPEFDEYKMILKNIKHRALNDYQAGLFALPKYIDFSEFSNI